MELVQLSKCKHIYMHFFMSDFIIYIYHDIDFTPEMLVISKFCISIADVPKANTNKNLIQFSKKFILMFIMYYLMHIYHVYRKIFKCPEIFETLCCQIIRFISYISVFQTPLTSSFFS